MMSWLFDTLRQYPEIAIFLALALGFWVGQMKFGTFSLGVVTSTLLAGILIGQLGITISPHVKSVFFLMFLFAVGYAVGPQFFRGLKSEGLPQVLFAVMLCVLCLLSTFFVAKVMGYHTGFAAGLLSGACTISAVLGVASDTISQLGISGEQKKAWIDAMPVAYAVTYIFGTAGSAWILGTLGPEAAAGGSAGRVQEARGEHGRQRGGARRDLDLSALRGARLPAHRQPVHRQDRGGVRAALRRTSGCSSCASSAATRRSTPSRPRSWRKDMIVALVGRREFVLEAVRGIGVEVDEPELLDITAEILDVVVTNKALAGQDVARARRGRPGAAVPRRLPAQADARRPGNAVHARHQGRPRRRAAARGAQGRHRARREGRSATPTGSPRRPTCCSWGWAS